MLKMDSRKKAIPLAKIVAVPWFNSFKDYGSLWWTFIWILSGQPFKGPDYGQTLHPFVCKVRCLHLYFQQRFPSGKPMFRYVP